MNNQSIGNFFPAPGRISPNSKIGSAGVPFIDSAGNLCTRGAITTDEGSVREDFTGTTIYSTIAGTSVSFINGSNVVRGVGTTFTDGTIAYGDYIKLSTDSDTYYARVQTVISDTELRLVSNYTGTTGTGTAYKTMFKPITGTGGTISVASSNCTIASGTTTGSKIEVTREVDYGPLVIVATASVSQRIANQTGYIGLVDDATNPGIRAWFRIDGTTNTTVVTETAFSSSANDTETNTVTLPSGANTSTANRYRIELGQEYCAFYINDVLLATHKTHLPNPYAVMDGVCGWVNGTTPASTSSIVLDQFFIGNVDALQIMTGFGTLPLSMNNTQIGNQAIATGGMNGQQAVNMSCATGTSNGTNHTLIAAATTNATSVKASAGRVHSILLTNASASIKFFKLYNKASAPTVGTDTPILTVGVPATSTIQVVPNDIGIYCSTGIAYALTGLITLADTTALAANDMSVNIIYA